MSYRAQVAASIRICLSSRLHLEAVHTAASSASGTDKVKPAISTGSCSSSCYCTSCSRHGQVAAASLPGSSWRRAGSSSTPTGSSNSRRRVGCCCMPTCSSRTRAGGLEQVRSSRSSDTESEAQGSFRKAPGRNACARHAPEVTNPRRRESSPEKGTEVLMVLARSLRRTQTRTYPRVSAAVSASRRLAGQRHLFCPSGHLTECEAGW
jgi:hypothetical protein